MRSAIVVTVPEAELLVGEFRRRYDPVARRGMPAHVTVLYPFAVPPVTSDDRDALRAIAGVTIAFSYVLVAARRFPNVLWLDPQPAQPFCDLVRRIVAQWPERLPYAGEHSEIIPHLTVAQGGSTTLDKIDAALAPQLPVAARASCMTLMTEADGRWSVFEQYPFQENPV